MNSINKIRLKKILLTLSIVIPIVSFVIVTPILVIGCSNGSSTKTLNSQTVNNYFNEGNKWFGRTSLDAKDFTDFNEISGDAFDNLPNNIKLDYIELPSNIKITCQDNAIKWNAVNQIKTINNGNEDLFVVNNILFQKNNTFAGANYYYALTISNRLSKQELIFPTNQQFSSRGWYLIANNFYDENIFSNITTIKFSIYNKDNPYWLPLKEVGYNAFANCHKLDSSLLINVNSVESNHNIMWMFYLQENAFYNTNIESIKVFCNGNYVGVGSNAIGSCANLKNIKLISKGIIAYGYQDMSKTKSISYYLSSNIGITIAPNALAGTYESFEMKLYILMNEWPEDFNPNSFSGINCNVNNFSFQYSLITSSPDKDKEKMFKNTGLTPEQYDKVTWINPVFDSQKP